MTYRLALPSSLAALSLALAACSSERSAPDTATQTQSAAPSSAEPAPTAEPTSPSTPAGDASASAAHVLALEGLGDLRVGKPVPKASSWA
ncbi:hypothetical protein [Novosphingobium sp. 9U]|uniref:hypothetical protein n=1 Tax=Novosphingobium sp. 9U TaxID=2653158 RepID=UPI001F3B9DE6|nr:hypothetical protein [Novosphingobium sp. 9U]